MTIVNSLSRNLALYDLQKPRYVYPLIAATPKKGRGHFGIFRCTQKIDTRAKFFHNHLNELFQLSKLLDIEMHTGLWQALRVRFFVIIKTLWCLKLLSLFSLNIVNVNVCCRVANVGDSGSGAGEGGAANVYKLANDVNAH